MSEIFLVNISETDLDYANLNSFANEITSFALKYQMGIHFNELGYFPQLISECNMKKYFFVSDSFLHCNATFLDMCEFAYLDGEDYKKAFYQKFSFVNQIVDILKKYEILKVQFFISDDGSVESEGDFFTLQSTGNELLDRLYECVLLNDYPFELPTIKINLSL